MLMIGSVRSASVVGLNRGIFVTSTTLFPPPKWGRRQETTEVKPAQATKENFKNKPMIIQTHCVSPFRNIGLEERLWNRLIEEGREEPVLYLWRNESSIIIGRHQNPFRECHLQRMEEDGIHLVRRYSGGGAVYQDLGNSIFSFIAHKQFHCVERNMRILCNALSTFNIHATPTGRNDIHVGDQKISGSAFKFASNRGLHHGTLLLDLNLNALQNYLNPNKMKLDSKGIKSVISRVQNLKELAPQITHELVCDSLIKSFLDEWNLTPDEVEFVTLGKQGEILEGEAGWGGGEEEREVQVCVAKLLDKKFRYGNTPPFTHVMEARFSWGNVEVNINSKRSGVITESMIYSDCLFPDLITILNQSLEGRDYFVADVRKGMEWVREEIVRESDRRERGEDGAMDVPIDPCLSFVDEFEEWLVEVM